MKSNNPFAEFGDAAETEEGQSEEAEVAVEGQTEEAETDEQDGDIGKNPFLFGEGAMADNKEEGGVLKNPWEEEEEEEEEEQGLKLQKTFLNVLRFLLNILTYF